jgi:hypothetical protein
MQRLVSLAKPSAEHASTRAAPRRNRTMNAPALAALAVGLLIALTPFAQAGSVRHAATYTPPYTGKGLVSVTTSTLGCGVKTTITTAPKFTTITGVAIGAGKAKAVSCSSPLGYNTAKAGAGVGYFTKTFTGVSGPHHVVVHWTVSWSSVLTAKLGPGFTGSAYASSYLVATLYLLDSTNLTYLPPSSSWSWFSSTANGTVTNHSSATFAMYLNQTLVSSHVYSITPAISLATYASASSVGPTSASAYLSLAGPGTSTKLLSISIT